MVVNLLVYKNLVPRELEGSGLPRSMSLPYQSRVAATVSSALQKGAQEFVIADGPEPGSGRWSNERSKVLVVPDAPGKAPLSYKLDSSIPTAELQRMVSAALHDPSKRCGIFVANPTEPLLSRYAGLCRSGSHEDFIRSMKLNGVQGLETRNDCYTHGAHLAALVEVAENGFPKEKMPNGPIKVDFIVGAGFA